MIHLLLIEKNAREKIAMLSYLQNMLTPEACIGVFRDRIDINTADLDEWNYASQPSIIIIGQDTAKTSPDVIARARNKFSKATIIVMVEEQTLAMLQHFTLYGAHNIIRVRDSESALFGCILSSLSKNDEIKRGKLILIDGGKGGVGATTFAAAFGAKLSSQGLKVTLVDLDFESQDLARFFKVRPYLNETLEVLLTQGNFISVEQIVQSSHQVWDGDALEVVPPAPALEGLIRGNQNTLRQFRLVLEVIDSLRDVVIVDMAGLTSSAAKKLYDIADNVVYLVSLDPSTVHASLARLKLIVSASATEHKINLVPVSFGRDGISSPELIREFERCIKVKGATWSEDVVPFLPSIRQWPASGSSPVEFSSAKYKAILSRLGTNMGLHSDVAEKNVPVLNKILNLTKILFNRIKKSQDKKIALTVEFENTRLLQLPSEGDNKINSLITKA